MQADQLQKIQINKTNSKNRHLVFLTFKKKGENNGVGDISSLFQRHCQTNRLLILRTSCAIYIYKASSILA